MNPLAPLLSLRLPFVRRYLVVGMPLIVFLALVALFYVRLGAGDASRIPSALIGKRVPEFRLPVLDLSAPAAGASPKVFTDADLRQGHVSVVNVFASWCGPCHDEHPLLVALAHDPLLLDKGIRLVGIANKDSIGDTESFLLAAGNPYSTIGIDKAGRTSIDWGVYGVPETFIVKGDGTIASKFIGPMTDEALTTTILPELRKLAR